MYRRNFENSPTLAYIVSVLPFVLVIFFCNALYTTNKYGTLINFYSYVLLVMFVIWSICAVVYLADVLLPKFALFLLFGGLAVSFLILLLTIFNYVSSYSFNLQSILKKTLVALTALLALVIILIVVGFFMPGAWKTANLSSDLREWVTFFQNDWKMTSWVVFVLLGVELAIIAAYYLIPALIMQTPFTFSTPHFNGILWLYRGRRMLTQNEETVVARSNDLRVTNPEFEGNPYVKNYSVSMWVYTNAEDAQMTAAEAAQIGPTNLFYYGTQRKTASNQWEMVFPKPRVAYVYDYGTMKFAYVIYLTGLDPYYLYLENQKWHALVFVFEDNHIHLFVDGTLNKSFGTPTLMPEFTENDIIVLGDIQGAVYGAIADVIYYDHPLTPERVITNWNLQKYTIDTR